MKRLARSIALVAAVGLLLQPATGSAEPAVESSGRGAVEYDLALHYGLIEHEEPDRYGIYPSLVLGGKFDLSPSLHLLARLAATPTRGFENIGGFGTGYLGAEYQPPPDPTLGWAVEAGVTLPLDRSLPLANGYPTPDRPSDSMVYSYDWDYYDSWKSSAFRRSALERGAWNAWMWAPDWLTLVGAARVDYHLDRKIGVTAEVGAGLAIDVMEAREGSDLAFVLQAALAPQLRLSPRSAVGLRASLVDVFLDDASPLIVAAGPFYRWQRGRHQLRLGLVMPFLDLRHAPPDDMSETIARRNRIWDNWSVNLVGEIGF